MINDHKTDKSEEWKIQLNMHANFISSNDTGETRVINTLSANKEIMLGNETDNIALNHQNIRNHPEKVLNIKPFIDQYNWKNIDFSAHQNGKEESKKPKNMMLIGCKKFEQNNKTIALNILYVGHNKKGIGVAYRSIYNREHENQVVLLMIYKSSIILL